MFVGLDLDLRGVGIGGVMTVSVAPHHTTPHHTSHIYTFSGPRSPSQPAPNTFSVTRLSCPASPYSAVALSRRTTSRLTQQLSWHFHILVTWNNYDQQPVNRHSVNTVQGG